MSIDDLSCVLRRSSNEIGRTRVRTRSEKNHLTGIYLLVGLWPKMGQTTGL